MEHATDHLLIDSLMASPMGLGLFDSQERLRRANDAFLEALAGRMDEAPTWESLMRDCHRYRRGMRIEAEDIDAWIADAQRQHREVPTRSFEAALVDGRRMWVNEMRQPDGSLLVLMTDVTALKSRRGAGAGPVQETQFPPFELPNRRQIFSRLDDLLAVATQMRVPLSVVVLHIDEFKHISALHGAAAGDLMLQHLSEQLRRQLRSLDAVGRIGGEEFLLLLPNTAIEGAHHALRRLQALLQEQALVPGLPGLRCTLSSGVAQALPGDSADGVFNRADRALYLARARGQHVGSAASVAPTAASIYDQVPAEERAVRSRS